MWMQRRKKAAYRNGYNPLSTGVHTIIADGLRGTDERLIPVEGGEYVQEAKIGTGTVFRTGMDGFGDLCVFGSKESLAAQHLHTAEHQRKKSAAGRFLGRRMDAGKLQRQ